jgi:hypothetical protein
MGIWRMEHWSEWVGNGTVMGIEGSRQTDNRGEKDKHTENFPDWTGRRKTAKRVARNEEGTRKHNIHKLFLSANARKRKRKRSQRAQL